MYEDLRNCSDIEQFGKCRKLGFLGCSSGRLGMSGWEGRQLKIFRRDDRCSGTRGSPMHVRN